MRFPPKVSGAAPGAGKRSIRGRHPDVLSRHRSAYANEELQSMAVCVVDSLLWAGRYMERRTKTGDNKRYRHDILVDVSANLSFGRPQRG